MRYLPTAPRERISCRHSLAASAPPYRRTYMPYADVNGIKLYYEEHGNGTPLLLIMGFTANATAWEALIPYLARQHRTIAFDNRGSGRSDQPEGAYTMAQLADDAVGLLDVLGIQRAHV